MAESLKTTFVSRLEEISQISTNDLLLVSQLSGTEYKSTRITYENLSSILVGDVDSKIQAQIDSKTKMLSDAISVNYNAIADLNDNEKSYESAIVKVANCINQAKADIQVLCARIALDEVSCRYRDQLLCVSISSRSDYLSSAARYISSQVSANCGKLSSDICYLSSQHDQLSTQFSTQLSSRIQWLCSSISTTVDLKLSDLSSQLSVVSGDLSAIDIRTSDLESNFNSLNIPDYSEDINALSHHMFDATGNVGILCARGFSEDSRNMRLLSAFNDFDDADAAKSTMRDGDVVIVNGLEYYLSGGSLHSFGDDRLSIVLASADYWNTSYTTLSTLKDKWNDVYNIVNNNESEWQKATIVSKEQLRSENVADATIYFCTDE